MLGANEVVRSVSSSLSEIHNVTEDTKPRKSPTTALSNRNRMQTTCLKCSRSCNKQKETDEINLMILHLAQYSQNIILTYNQY